MKVLAMKKLWISSSVAAAALFLCVSPVFALKAKPVLPAARPPVKSKAPLPRVIEGVDCVAGEVLVSFREGVDPSKGLLRSGVRAGKSERLLKIAPAAARYKKERLQKIKGCWYPYLQKERLALDKLTEEQLFELARKNMPEDEKALYRIYLVKLASGERVESAIPRFTANPDVEFAEPNFIVKLDMHPNDTLYPQQWFHQNIGSEQAWDITQGDPGVVIAVIDTGVAYDHEDLAGNMWVNTGEIAGDGIDNDFNGHIDDVYGWNASDGNGDPYDIDSHGTRCAGIVAAVTNNLNGVAGVCPRARIMAVRSFDMYGANITSTCPGIKYAADNGADIISMSFGDYINSETEHSFVRYAYNKGIFLVAAAGNDEISACHYPSAFEEVFSTAAIDQSNSKADFSNFGTTVDAAAPGGNILSTTLGLPPGGAYGAIGGTSSSCPQVAGLAALILSVHPNFTPLQVANTIKVSSKTDITSSEYIGAGRISAADALAVSNPPSSRAIIRSPVYGDALDGQTLEVRGMATGTSYKLFLSSSGPYAPDAEWVEIGQGTYVLDGLLGTYDASGLAAANYFIKLVVFDSSPYPLSSVSKFVSPTCLPKIKSISPDKGLAGMEVIIQGYNFQDNGTVYFGSDPATEAPISPGGWSNKQIVCAVPALDPDDYGVTVVNSLGTSNISPFEVLREAPKPIIEKLIPPEVRKGDVVDVWGDYFGDSDGGGYVSFGQARVASTNTVHWCSNSIDVVVPDLDPGTYSVTVTAAGGTSNSKPLVVSLNPKPYIVYDGPLSGNAGDIIEVQGYYFTDTPGSVSIGGKNAQIVFWEDRRIRVIVPGDLKSGVYSLSVANSNGVSNAVPFKVHCPRIRSLNPQEGLVGICVKIEGSNFGPSRGNGVVFFGSREAKINSWSDNEIEAVVPLDLSVGEVDVVVSVDIGDDCIVSAPVVFKVTAPPVITGINRPSGLPGEVIIITGSGFGATRGPGFVAFGNTINSSINSWSDSEIKVVVPNIAPGWVDVRVCIRGGGSNVVPFRIAGPPFICYIPNPRVGVPLEILGYDFRAAGGHVDIQQVGGPIIPIPASQWTDTSIRTYYGINVSGTFDVWVTNVAGTTSNVVRINVILPPAVQKLKGRK